MQRGADRVTSLPAAQQQALADATRDEFERYDIVQRAIVEKLVVDADRPAYDGFCRWMAGLQAAVKRRSPSKPAQPARDLAALFAHAAAVKPAFDQVTRSSALR